MRAEQQQARESMHAAAFAAVCMCNVTCLSALQLARAMFVPAVSDEHHEVLQGQSEDVAQQLNEEEQLLIITRLHQVRSTCTLPCDL